MDLKDVRKEFPIIKDWIFLDNAGAVPLPLFVTEEMRSFIEGYYKEGITDHWPLLVETIDDCREKFSGLIGARREEVALVSSTSEGLNIVANMLDFQAEDNVVLTDVEFPSNLFPWLNLRRIGVDVRVAPILGSEKPLDVIAEYIDTNTKVVAVSHVSFANGMKLDLSSLSELAHSNKAYLVVDAVQSAGVIPLDVERDGVDFLACSGFKWLMSPSGTGAFYCRKEHLGKFDPAYISWFSVEQPFNFVPGNPMQLADDASRFTISGNINLIGYQGFRKGLQFILDVGVEQIWSHVNELCGVIREYAQQMKIESLSPSKEELWGPIVNLRVPQPDLLVESLREEKIYTVQRLGGLRISPHIYNTSNEIEILIERLHKHIDVWGTGDGEYVRN